MYVTPRHEKILLLFEMWIFFQNEIYARCHTTSTYRRRWSVASRAAEAERARAREAPTASWTYAQVGHQCLAASPGSSSRGAHTAAWYGRPMMRAELITRCLEARQAQYWLLPQHKLMSIYHAEPARNSRTSRGMNVHSCPLQGQ